MFHSLVDHTFLIPCKCLVQEHLIASRKFEAEASALAHTLENEKMRQADIEAQACHAISRRNDIVQAYQPMLKRIHAAESMQQDAQFRADAATQEKLCLQTQHESTLRELAELKQEIQHLAGIEIHHASVLRENSELKNEMKEVRSI